MYVEKKSYAHCIYVNMLYALWVVFFFLSYFREFKIMIVEPPCKKFLELLLSDNFLNACKFYHSDMPSTQEFKEKPFVQIPQYYHYLVMKEAPTIIVTINQ